jgi:hypothetical protein
MSLVFEEIRQIAYVTRDCMAAMKFFVEAGVGPWFYVEKRFIPNVNYRGKTIDLNFKVGLANSGFIQFEIIEPDPNAPSLYNEWLEQHPKQMVVQHLSSWPLDYDKAHANGLSRGYKPVLEGDTETGRFVYFQHPQRPEFSMEMAELTPARKSMFGKIAEANKTWDGKDPIRYGRPE